ncbi:MAG: hypothetical protein M0Q49_01205 [Porticoccaceae bacterium]|nr:hypothetical protein [Porticoccaceae bacterium]
MVLRTRPLAIGVAVLLFSSWAVAVGLGEVQLHSALNEPLDAKIRLHNLGDLTENEILAGLASAREFSRAGLEREAILSELSFNVDLSNTATPLLRVTSKRPIREPYLNFLVDMRWPAGRLLREYTLLLDLPISAADRQGMGAEQAPVPMVEQSQEASAHPVTGGAHEASSLPEGSEYRVGSGETLWSIAARLSGGGSVHSKMTAIYQLNPGAFINGDISLLAEGALLRLPAGSQMAADSAPSVAASPVDAAVAPGFEDVASADPRGVDPATSDRLDLLLHGPNAVDESAQPVSPQGGMEPERNSLQVLRDELELAQRENRELKSQLASLEEQLATMQQLTEEGSNNALLGAQRAGSDKAVDAAGQGIGRVVAPESAQASELPAQNALTTQSLQPTESLQLTESSELAQKGWFEVASSYLLYILGTCAALIAVLVLVLRKRWQDSDEFSTSSAEHQKITPGPAAVSAGASETVWPPVSSLDEIALEEEDDLFAAARQEQEAGESREPAVAPESSVRGDPSPEADEAEAVELHLSEFELDSLASAAEDEASAVLDEALSLDDLDFIGDADEGETQLDLAQAYLEMGDQGSAREILQEVLEAASENHKERARVLLDALS